MGVTCASLVTLTSARSLPNGTLTVFVWLPRDKRGGGNITYWMGEAGIEIELVPMRMVPTNLTRSFLIRVSIQLSERRKIARRFMEKLGKSRRLR